MDKLKVIFKRIREDFKAYVPPLTETVDQEHHYEVWYITDKEKFFFGSIVLHQDYAEITFLSDISQDTKATLYPEDIFKRMGSGYTCQIKDLSPELEENIKEVISNLIDYIQANLIK